MVNNVQKFNSFKNSIASLIKKENNKIYYFIELIYRKFDLTGFRDASRGLCKGLRFSNICWHLVI